MNDQVKIPISWYSFFIGAAVGVPIGWILSGPFKFLHLISIVFFVIVAGYFFIRLPANEQIIKPSWVFFPLGLALGSIIGMGIDGQINTWQLVFILMLTSFALYMKRKELVILSRQHPTLES